MSPLSRLNQLKQAQPRLPINKRYDGDDTQKLNHNKSSQEILFESTEARPSYRQDWGDKNSRNASKLTNYNETPKDGPVKTKELAKLVPVCSIYGASRLEKIKKTNKQKRQSAAMANQTQQPKTHPPSVQSHNLPEIPSSSAGNPSKFAPQHRNHPLVKNSMPLSTKNKQRKAQSKDQSSKFGSSRRQNDQSPRRAIMPRISQQDIVRLIHSSEQSSLEPSQDVVSNKHQPQSELFA